MSRRNILRNHTPGSHHTMRTNTNTLNYYCSRTYMSIIAHIDSATEHRTWRDMHMATQTTIVLDNCSTIDNAIISNFCACLNYDTWHSLHTVSKFNIFGDKRSGVDHAAKTIPSLLQH